VSPVRYELGFYVPEDDILHSPRRENLRAYISQEKYPERPVLVLDEFHAMSDT
jgi:hypothetical protein